MDKEEKATGGGIVTDGPGKPKGLPSISADTERDAYFAALYTQLIINGKAPNNAIEIAKEAADYLYRSKYTFPNIVVG